MTEVTDQPKSRDPLNLKALWQPVFTILVFENAIYLIHKYKHMWEDFVFDKMVLFDK